MFTHGRVLFDNLCTFCHHQSKTKFLWLHFEYTYFLSRKNKRENPKTRAIFTEKAAETQGFKAL